MEREQWERERDSAVRMRAWTELTRQYNGALGRLLDDPARAAQLGIERYESADAWLAAARDALYEQWRAAERRPEAERLTQPNTNQQAGSASVTSARPAEGAPVHPSAAGFRT